MRLYDFNYTLLTTYSGESGILLQYSIWESDTFRVQFTSDSSIVSTGFHLEFELGVLPRYSYSFDPRLRFMI